MKLRTVLLLAVTTVLPSPLIARAQSKSTPPSTPPGKASTTKVANVRMYECQICHHKIDAAEAKKFHYICPVDHGKLVPVKATSQRKSPKPPNQK